MPLGDIHIGRKEATIIQRYAAHVEDRTIRSLTLELIGSSFSGKCQAFSDLLLDFARPVLAAKGVEADQIL